MLFLHQSEEKKTSHYTHHVCVELKAATFFFLSNGFYFIFFFEMGLKSGIRTLHQYTLYILYIHVITFININIPSIIVAVMILFKDLVISRNTVAVNAAIPKRKGSLFGN